MFRSIIQNAPIGVLVVDTAGQIVFCNTNASHMLSCDDVTVLGARISDILPSLSILNGQIDIASRTDQDGDLCNLFAIPSADGIKRYCEVQISQSHTVDQGQLNAVILTEVTSRVHALQAVQDQEERWNLALQGSQIGVFESDLRTGAGFASETWYRLLGISRIKGRDSDAEWHARVHPDDLNLVVSIDAQCIEGLSEKAEAKFRMRVQDGTWHWMRSILRVVERDEVGKAVRLLGTMTDITDEKRLDALKDDFVATVSHELRTPLAALYGAIGLLGGSIDQATAEKTEKLLGIAHRNTVRLIQVVDELLDFQKLRAGHFSIEMKPVDFAEVIRQVAIDNEIFAEKFGVTFALDLPDREVMVSADPLRLNQVITNLLSNAAKFSLPGGIVEVSLACTNKDCRVSVTDYGCGILPEFGKRIFTPFSQQADLQTRTREGSGLGLAIAKGLTEAMSGEIGYTSEPNVRTTFWIQLSLLPQDASRQDITQM